MPVKILMPALSPTMEHGNLAKWIKKEGDTVSAGEVIAEIETDKATMEVEAVDEGVLGKIVVQEGAQEVAVNSLIAVLLEEGEDVSSIDEFIAKNSAAAPVAKPEAEAKPATVAVQSFPAAKPEAKTLKTSPAGRILASPLAKRIASNEGIILSSIVGTGPHGRIVKADVLSGGSARGRVQRHSQEYNLVPNSNMRKVIAKRLVESKQTVPHFYLALECAMDSVLEVPRFLHR